VADDAKVLDRARTLGVPILVNSWGYDQPDPPIDPTDPVAVMGAIGPFIDAAQRYVDADGLLLFAAGNAGDTDAESIAALPSLFPTLQRGWLTVVATNAAGTALAGYSNQRHSRGHPPNQEASPHMRRKSRPRQPLTMGAPRKCRSGSGGAIGAIGDTHRLQTGCRACAGEHVGVRRWRWLS
jgi:hypothetical protein